MERSEKTGDSSRVDPCLGGSSSTSQSRKNLVGRHPWAFVAAGAVVGAGAAKWFLPEVEEPADDVEDADRCSKTAAAVRRKTREERAARDEVRRHRDPSAGRLALYTISSVVMAAAKTALGNARTAAIHRFSDQLAGPAVDERLTAESKMPHRLHHWRPAPQHEKPEQKERNDSNEQRSWWALIKQTFSDWVEDKASQLGAALAYYTVFSLAPLLVIVLSIAGLVFGEAAAMGEIRHHLQGFLGQEGAAGVEAMVSASRSQGASIVAGIFGIIALLFGATGVFGQLQDSLNTIWEVEPKPGGGFWGMIKDRFLSFAMVLGIGFLLLVSLVLSAAVGTLTAMFGEFFGGAEVVAHVADVVVSFAIITILFALIFKLLPDVEIAWKDVWIGAAVTAVLFVIGKYLIGMYLGRSAISSTYGAAASLVIVLLWAYYSSQILFLGAEFTQAYARMYGSRIRPAPDAQPTAGERSRSAKS